MKKTLLFTLIFFLIYSKCTGWTALLRFIVVANAIVILITIAMEAQNLIKER